MAGFDRTAGGAMNVEALEGRRLLAGNVTAAVIGGDLVITGDAARNRIVVTTKGVENAGEVRIVGADDDTTINGGFDAVLSGITGRVRIALGAGADTVHLRDLTLGRAVIVHGGRGGDTVAVQNAALAAGLDLLGGSGDDTVTMLDSTVGGRAGVATGDGGDLVYVDETAFAARASVDGGAGADVISAAGGTFNGGRRIAVDAADRAAAPLALSYSFAGGRSLGWRAGFADYPVGREADWALEEGIADLPAELGAGKGFALSGDNHSDDLFMYLTRRVGAAQGLKPNTDYLVRIAVTFGSDAPSGSFGVGGSTGDSVYVKVGATTAAPGRVADGDDAESHWRSTVDKGDQATDGRDMTGAGTIANGDTADQPRRYKSLRRAQVHAARVRTDGEGNLWLIVGTDSGFEAVSRVYYQGIDVRVVEV